MNKNNLTCPEINILSDYFSNNLVYEKQMEIEEHCFECSHCIQTVREMAAAHSMQMVAKANPLLGDAWKIYGDEVEAKAAGEKNASSIQELVTRNGMYKVTLRPLKNNPDKALLEIEALTPSAKGRLEISSTCYYNEIVEIDDNNFACTVVNNSIDLNRVIIKKRR